MSSLINPSLRRKDSFVYTGENETELLDLLFSSLKEKPNNPTSVGLLFSELNIITSVGTIEQLKDYIEAVIVKSGLVDVLEKRISSTFRLSHTGIIELKKHGTYSAYVNPPVEFPQKKYYKYSRDHVAGKWVYEKIVSLDYDQKPPNSKEENYVPVDRETEDQAASIKYEIGTNNAPILTHSPVRSFNNSDNLINPTITTTTPSSPKTKSGIWRVVEIMAWIIAIITGCIAIYEFIVKPSL
jgi:hypothetical protein